MTGQAFATTWHGRRGPVLLGPTEARVARYLADLTRHGIVTVRTVDLATTLQLERSEGFRILARLRVLGLFGVANDPGGTRGGRRIWRTSIEHDGPGLDPDRHRVAWSRIVAWARARRARLDARLEAIRNHTSRAVPRARAARGGGPVPRTSARPDLTRDGLVGADPPGGGPTFAERMRAAGLGPLMDTWRANHVH